MTAYATNDTTTTPRQSPSPWLGRILLANLVAEVGIVVTGGAVRLTGSGLGCPTWPQCQDGSLAPRIEASTIHTAIEFGNRMLTGVLAILALLTVIAVHRWAPRRPMKVAAWAVLGGVALQAIIGGITVLTGLHPLTVSIHFMVSAVLIACSAYLWFAREDTAGPTRSLVPALVDRLAWATVGVGVAVLALGTVVTGSGPHSGDADEPNRYGFDVRSVSWLHADLVMLFVGLVIATVVAVRLTTSTTGPRRAWTAVLAVTLAQGLLGYAQYFTGVPAILVGLHMLGASLLVVALTAGMHSLRTPA